MTDTTSSVAPASPDEEDAFRLTDLVRGGDATRRARTALTLAAPGGRSLTFDELDRRSNRVARALAAAGVQPGDRVPMLDLNSIELFEVVFGALKAGGVFTPVNWRLTPAEVRAILVDSGAGVVVAGPQFADLATGATDGTGMRVIVTGDEYESLLAAADDSDPGETSAADDTVLQLYTSGTTGLPKGVMLTNRNLSTLARVAAMLAFGPDSVNMVAMPNFHIGGIGPGLIGLHAGCHTFVVPAFEPGAVLDLMESERVTNAFLVPAAFSMMAALPGAADRDWSALQSLSYGASPITVEALRTVLATFHTPMMQVYGMTETTGAIVQLDPEDHDPGGPREHLLRSAGKPYPWVELKVVDVATGAELPPGEVGELLVRSKAVTAGYWNRPQETADTIAADGWLRTGDGGYLDPEGYLFLTDRIKDMIVSGAENIYPIEVENVLADHPGIADVAVIGVPHEKWGETVKAVVVPRPGVTLDPDEVLSWAKERLAGYKRPTSIDVVAELPRNPSGKILKKDLRAPYWEGVGRRIG
ncbi:MAG TPA: long-chain-fatty-acid--CoA ligase [Mycobacteriales bacterium]